MFRFAFGIYAACLSAKSLSLQKSPKRSKTISGCAAKYARALSTETTTAANSLKYLLWVARFFVLRQRYSMGLESGEYDGKGCSVIRSLRAAKKACVDALV